MKKEFEVEDVKNICEQLIEGSIVDWQHGELVYCQHCEKYGRCIDLENLNSSVSHTNLCITRTAEKLLKACE